MARLFRKKEEEIEETQEEDKQEKKVEAEQEVRVITFEQYLAQVLNQIILTLDKHNKILNELKVAAGIDDKN